jgi:3D (Asp-Asp-Asp) domain-containing protein
LLIGIHVLATGEQVITDDLIIGMEGRDHVEEAKAKQRVESRRKAPPVDSRRVTERRNNTAANDANNRHIEVVATAYTAFCNTGCTGVTATGLDVSNTITHEGKRIIATDPNVIPLGTDVTLKLPNGKTIEAVSADTGGAIDGARIDLLVGSKQEAINFGRQSVKAVIH